MNIKPLASGSDGNAYIISDEETTLLIECGISFAELQRLSGFKISQVDGCLISHSHNDHAKSVKDVMAAGVDCYMSKQTVESLKLNSHRVNLMRSEKQFSIGTFDIMPLEMNHDVYCLGFLIYSNKTNEKLLFATDTYFIQWRIPELDYLMVEANYDMDILNRRIANGDTDMVAMSRLLKSHQEIGNLIKWLEQNDLSKIKRIYLLHLSGGSSNEDDFKLRVMQATGKPVTIC